MIQVLQASELTLHEVKIKFNLQRVDSSNFFPEWQVPVLELSLYERQTLDRAREDFLYLIDFPVHEEIVKLVVLAPLLSVAGFYRHPFHPVAEKSVEIAVEEADTIIRARIDVLVLNEQLWVTVIESKSKRFSITEALPQALVHMLSNPMAQKPAFGLITNGSELMFLKLHRGDAPQYAVSGLFSLFNPGNDLYRAVGILRQLGQIS